MNILNYTNFFNIDIYFNIYDKINKTKTIKNKWIKIKNINII